MIPIEASALIVEDNKTTQFFLTHQLQHWGWTVAAVGTVAAALAALASETFAVILLDLGLPDGDGLAVLREVRRQALPTAVVVVTARSQEQIDASVELQALQPDAVFVTPYPKDELKARLDLIRERWTAHHEIAPAVES